MLTRVIGALLMLTAMAVSGYLVGKAMHTPASTSIPVLPSKLERLYD